MPPAENEGCDDAQNDHTQNRAAYKVYEPGMGGEKTGVMIAATRRCMFGCVAFAANCDEIGMGFRRVVRRGQKLDVRGCPVWRSHYEVAKVDEKVCVPD